MEKIILGNGQEIEISFIAVSSMGNLYIECDLPIAEAFNLFIDSENTKSFVYSRTVETSPSNFEVVDSTVEGFVIFVGVERVFTNFLTMEPKTRITLRKSEGVN